MWPSIGSKNFSWDTCRTFFPFARIMVSQGSGCRISHHHCGTDQSHTHVCLVADLIHKNSVQLGKLSPTFSEWMNPNEPQFCRFTRCHCVKGPFRCSACHRHVTRLVRCLLSLRMRLRDARPGRVTATLDGSVCTDAVPRHPTRAWEVQLEMNAERSGSRGQGLCPKSVSNTKKLHTIGSLRKLKT